MSTSSHPVIDGILAVSLVIHSHIGFDSVLEDYIHPRKFPVLGPVGKWGLRAVTATVLVGVYQFNTTVGDDRFFKTVPLIYLLRMWA